MSEKQKEADAIKQSYQAYRKNLTERREELKKFLGSVAAIERIARNAIVDNEIICIKLKEAYLNAGGNINDL